MRKILLLLVGLLIGLQAFSATFTFKFDGKGFISDGAEILDDSDRDKILFYSEYVKAQTSYSIIVVTLETLDGVSASRVAKVVSEKGGNNADDTLVLVVVPDEGKIGVEIGENLKSEISYVALKEIIQGEVTPAFKNGEYSKAITGGVYSISRIIEPSLVFMNPEKPDTKTQLAPRSKPIDTRSKLELRNEYIIGLWLALFALLMLFMKKSAQKRFKPRNERGGFGNDFVI